MTEKAMRLVLNQPLSSGETRVQKTRLLTPDGSEVTGVASIQVVLDASAGLMKTTIVLNRVVIEYKDGAPAGLGDGLKQDSLREVTTICSTAREFTTEPAGTA